MNESFEAGRQSMLDDICKYLDKNTKSIIQQIKKDITKEFTINKKSDYSKDKEIIEGIIEYLECWNDFDAGDEPWEQYYKRFEGYIKFMNELLNRLYGGV